MSKAKPTSKEKDVIPNMELILIFIFFGAFIVWAVSKCMVTQAKYEQEASLDNPVELVDSLKVASEPTEKKSKEKEAKEEKAVPKTKTVVKEVSALYVVLDELKLRKGPSRDSSIVKQFKLHERVYFLEEVTEFRERINLGSRVAFEPWIKVRSKSGHEGWVYGAGVNYHRQKFEPVLEE